MTELPTPLVPVEVDLRGYEFMPLYGDRLLNSETWIGGTDEERVAALRLWWHAYAKETPAGSLPHSDRFLAQYAGYGDRVKGWVKVRAQAMRNWVKCSDGRLYHPVLAGIVLSAWAMRLSASAKGRHGASKRWEKHRHDKSIAQAPEHDSWGNSPANEKHAIGQDRKGKGVNKYASTRGNGSQNLLKKSPESTATPETIAREKRIAERLMANDVEGARAIREGRA